MPLGPGILPHGAGEGQWDVLPLDTTHTKIHEHAQFRIHEALQSVSLRAHLRIHEHETFRVHETFRAHDNIDATWKSARPWLDSRRGSDASRSVGASYGGASKAKESS